MHWRTIVVLLVLAPAGLFVAQGNLLGVLAAVLLICIASQFFWLARVVDLAQWLFPRRRRRRLAIVVGLVYLFVFIYSYPQWSMGHGIKASDYRLQSIVIYSAFWWWFVGSMLAFLLVIAFGIVDRGVRALAWLYRRARRSMVADPPAVLAGPASPGRRRFLERAAVLASATPFVATGYGLLYERWNVEVVRQRIRLARLPKAFEGFRIAQLSDIHLGAFTSADYVRRCVEMTNGLKPDLVALTGDYVTWDPEDQVGAVHVLAGLRAPDGVFGCLGNHEEYVRVEDSITRLFAAQGIRMLRQERALVRRGEAVINVIGIDDPGDIPREAIRQLTRERKQQIKELVVPDTVNILLVHYPALFGESDLDIDLTLAGDLHGGGQMSLDFVRPGLNLAHLVGAPYVRGLHEKNGAQLYMNRGIGITGFPIRIGARPEITLLELIKT